MSRSTPAPGSAGSLVAPYLRAQLTALLAADDALGEGDETVVHAGRVAARRARSVLRVFAPLFDRSAADHLDAELRWWASTLGPVRDLQVLQDRLDAVVADLDEELVVGPVRTRIDVELGHDRLRHWAAVVESLSSDRHRALVDDLERWGTGPPWTATADRPAATLAAMVAGADHGVGERLEQAFHTGDVEDLHRARKAAKRARYAAEVVSGPESTRATKFARRYRRLQALLGEHHDRVVSGELLRRLADVADKAPGESGFTFGLLHERERARAREIERDTRRLARRLFT